MGIIIFFTSSDIQLQSAPDPNSKGAQHWSDYI